MAQDTVAQVDDNIPLFRYDAGQRFTSTAPFNLCPTPGRRL